MTYTPPASSVTNEGIDLTAIYSPYVSTSAISSTNDPANPGPPFAVGTRVNATNGSTWIFATTSTTIAQGSACMLNSAFSAALMGGTGALTAVPEGLAGFPAFYQNSTSMTTGQYAWFNISGPATILVASAGISVPLYTSDTAGTLTGATNTTSHYQISGVTCVVTASGSTASLTATVGNAVSVRKPLAGA